MQLMEISMDFFFVIYNHVSSFNINAILLGD